MRNSPEDDDDLEQLAELKAAPWMVESLKLNPSYTSWGPDEDYMRGPESGWSSPMRLDRWSDRPSLDDLNEVVNFYFEIRRESRKCPDCESGYSRHAQRLADEWYGKADPPFNAKAYGADPITVDHPALREVAVRHCATAPDYYGSDKRAIDFEARRLCDLFSKQWAHHLIQADVDALAAEDRLGHVRKSGAHPTAAEVNAWSMDGFGHDTINHWICVRARCERDGYAVECPTCAGKSYLYTAPGAHLALVAWLLHPRKGASRGVEIKRIEEGEMPDVLAWLSTAAQRNADRFSAAVAAASRPKP